MPRRVMEGVVVSNKMDKTAVVRVERTFLHPLFKKTVRKSKKYHAHDEKNAAKVGQLENTAEIKRVRRQIARLNTLIRQREIAEAEAAQ